MKTIIDETVKIPLWWDFIPGRECTDHEYRNCVFPSGRFSRVKTPEQRWLVENIRILDSQVKLSVGPAIFRNVLVENLSIPDALISWGAVFHHVVFRGKIDRIIFNQTVRPTPEHEALNTAFCKANSDFYKLIDWAMDIRDAEFVDVTLRGVPGHLIIRDTNTQVLVRREQVLDGKWKSLDLSSTHWPTAIESFLETGLKSTVLVAPKLNRNFPELLKGLNLLRDAGFAE